MKLLMMHRLLALFLTTWTLGLTTTSRNKYEIKKEFHLRKIYTGKHFEEECQAAEPEEEMNWLEDRGVEEFVNILGGSNSHHDVSYGNTLPIAIRPWGFNGYAPMTAEDPATLPWWFSPTDRRFYGIRVTHQPSPWIRDYGEFLLKAYMPADANDPLATQDRFTGYSPYQSEFHPYYFKTSLFAYGNSKGNVELELAPSQHGGILRVTFPPFVANEPNNDDPKQSLNYQLRRIAVSLFPFPNGTFLEIEKSPIDGTAMISGFTKKNSGGVGDEEVAAFSHYFVLTIYNGENENEITAIDSQSVKAENAWIDFSPNDPKNDVLTVRFATSYISKEQALQNLKWEVPLTKSFDDLVLEAQSEWRNLLSRVQITAPPEGYSDCQLKQMYSVFYTSLFRASIFPRQISEVDASGNLVHWSPYAATAENRVKSGPLSTDSGFWDAWNTVYPLLSLFNRPYLGTMMQGWLSAYEEGGWLPKWASPGYRGSMIGTMGDVSFAEAIVDEIPGFDTNKAYEAIRKDAYEIPPEGVDGVGRVCLESYLKHGYVPPGARATIGTCDQVVSRTLNYQQSDYAIAQAALKLGKTEDANDLLARSQNYSLLFDTNTGFFRSKDFLGRWTTPFDQYRWGIDYTESGPWQYRFYVPYDAEGLAKLYRRGGHDMCAELLKVQTLEQSIYHFGDRQYNEQIEMADHCWGQYAHNNQPAHHMLYMHMYDGYDGACSNQGRYWIREVLLKMYRPDMNMFPGDEDNGEMPAWFVLSALGLYQRSPGSGQFELGIPLFGRVEIDISDNAHFPREQAARSNGNATKLVIEAINNSYENTFVHRVLWNGKALSPKANAISYSLLREGGTLTFELGPQPTVRHA